jgi:hypothetical protein
MKYNNTVLIYSILSIIILACLYLFNNTNIENYQNRVVYNYIQQPTPPPSTSSIPLNLCNPEADNSNLYKELTGSIDILYNNHFNKNIKKYIDNHVAISNLTDKVKRINKKMQDNLHKGQEEIIFV